MAVGMGQWKIIRICMNIPRPQGRHKRLFHCHDQERTICLANDAEFFYWYLVAIFHNVSFQTEDI